MATNVVSVDSFEEWAKRLGYTAIEDGSKESKIDPSFICRRLSVEPLASFWRFVQDQMDSRKLSADDDQASRIQSLIHKRDELKSQCVNSKGKLETLRRDFASTQQEVLNSESSSQSQAEEWQVAQRRLALLGAHSRQLGKGKEVYESAIKKVNGKYKKHASTKRSTGSSNVYLAHEEVNVTKEAMLQSACMKDLKDVCVAVGSHLHDLFASENERESSSNEAALDKNEIWTKIEVLMSSYNPAEILSTLRALSENSTRLVDAKTRDIDLVRDAANLRFKFASGSLQDISEKPAVLKSVRDLIEEAQSMHFRRFIEAENANNKQWRKATQLRDIQEQIASSTLKGLVDDDQAAVVNHVMRLEARNSGFQAVMRCLEDAVQSLKAQLIERKQSVTLLQKKYQKIQEFEAMAQDKQKMIQALVRYNGGARQRLEAQADKLRSDGTSLMVSSQQKLNFLEGCVSEGYAKELQLFLEAPCRILHRVMVKNSLVPCHQLSIHRFSCSSQLSGHNTIRAILKDLRMSDCYSAEEMLTRVKGTYIRDLELLQRVSDQEANSKLLGKNVNHGELKRLKEMRAQIQESEAVHTTNNMAICSKEVAQATSSLSDCLELQQLLQSWWDQPAQHLAPWLEEDGMNVGKWIEQWTFQMTQLRQLQSAH